MDLDLGTRWGDRGQPTHGTNPRMVARIGWLDSAPKPISWMSALRIAGPCGRSQGYRGEESVFSVESWKAEDAKLSLPAHLVCVPVVLNPGRFCPLETSGNV